MTAKLQLPAQTPLLALEKTGVDLQEQVLLLTCSHTADFSELVDPGERGDAAELVWRRQEVTVCPCRADGPKSRLGGLHQLDVVLSFGK